MNRNTLYSKPLNFCQSDQEQCSSPTHRGLCSAPRVTRLYPQENGLKTQLETKF